MSEKPDRPIPVRSVVPPPASAPPAPPPVPAAPVPTAPIPARAHPDGTGAGLEPAVPPPPRLLEIDGRRWEVEAVGRTRTGQVPDAGAILLLVTFTPRKAEGEGEAVEDATSTTVREVLAVARSLEELDDEVLAELMERSRPMR